MMEQYRNDMNQLHASEALIQKTLHSISKEEKKIEKHTKNSKKVIMTCAGMAAAAAVVVGIYGTKSSNLMEYNQINIQEVKVEQITLNQDTMSMEEYSKYLGIDVKGLLTDETMVNSKITVTFKEDGKTPETELGKFYYKLDGKNLMIELSKTNSIAPEELLKGHESKIENTSIYLGESKDSGKLLAAGTIDGISFYVMEDQTEKSDYEQLVTKIIKNISKK